jgi:hypothetical protein
MIRIKNVTARRKQLWRNGQPDWNILRSSITSKQLTTDLSNKFQVTGVCNSTGVGDCINEKTMYNNLKTDLFST